MTTHADARPADWTNDDWETPDHVIERFEQEFGAVDLDPCARDGSAKAEEYYTIEEDGLRQPWFGRVWLNPPYSAPTPWVRKAHLEILWSRADLVIACLPPAIDTEWFHTWVLPFAEIRYHRGRIGFLDWTGQPVKNNRQGTLFAIYRRPS